MENKSELKSLILLVKKSIKKFNKNNVRELKKVPLELFYKIKI